MTQTFPTSDEIEQKIKADLRRIEQYRYSVSEIEDCLNVYRTRKPGYQTVLEQLALHLQSEEQLSDSIHSVRFRVKDYLHLADKLVRKLLDAKLSRRITSQNIFKFRLGDPEGDNGITDLGALRILHLRQSDWKPIHKYLVKGIDLSKRMGDDCRLSVVERKAFVPPHAKKWESYLGDAPEEGFSDDEINKEHKNRYTSLHYLLSSTLMPDFYIECQVRTLFEEGWGELDHLHNYPVGANQIVRSQLDSLNTAASVANEIASALETLGYLPLFVSWEAEQAIERSANKVTCLTANLAWVNKHLEKSIKHFQQASGEFQFWMLDDDTEATDNYNTVLSAIKSADLNERVKLDTVPKAHRVMPLLTDLLLLETASDPFENRVRNLAVVGAPGRIAVKRPEDELDMLLTGSAAARLKTFFQSLS